MASGFSAEDSVQNGIFVSNIDRMKADVGDEWLQILPFNQRIVKIVKIVDDGDRVPIGQQGFHQMRTDESGASGDQYLHIDIGSKLGGKSRGAQGGSLPPGNLSSALERPISRLKALSELLS